MTANIFGCTEKGPGRTVNEDRLLVAGRVMDDGSTSLRLGLGNAPSAESPWLLALADGIGGQAGGSVASHLALESLKRAFDAGAEAVRERIDAGARAANAMVLGAAREDPRLAGMGCTLAGLCLLDDRYVVFHAGDSRVYSYRDGSLTVLTSDDTLVGIAVRAGRLTIAEAASHPRRHILTNFVGSEEFSVTVRDGPVPRDGDVVLVCSDGLHDSVPPERLEAAFSGAAQNPDDLGARLLTCARQCEGQDDIAILILRFESGPA